MSGPSGTRRFDRRSFSHLLYRYSSIWYFRLPSRASSCKPRVADATASLKWALRTGDRRLRYAHGSLDGQSHPDEDLVFFREVGRHGGSMCVRHARKQCRVTWGKPGWAREVAAESAARYDASSDAMARLTFTLEDEVARELERAERHLFRSRAKLLAAIDQLPVEQAFLLGPVVGWLEQLDEQPSQAAIVRQAVAMYLNAIREVERSAALDEGYAALAADEEREAIIEAAARRVWDQWGDEP